jgi:hypothetical protein
MRYPIDALDKDRPVFASVPDGDVQSVKNKPNTDRRSGGLQITADRTPSDISKIVKPSIAQPEHRMVQ